VGWESSKFRSTPEKSVLRHGVVRFLAPLRRQRLVYPGWGAARKSISGEGRTSLPSARRTLRLGAVPFR